MTAYSVETSNASNKVTAVPADASASVSIALNGAPLENGSSATWRDGENTLTVTVTNRSAVTVYTVTVTK